MNPPGQLYVFWHDCHVFSMDSTQVTVFEQSDQIIFTGTLESVSCIGCKMETNPEILSDFPI